MANVFIYRRRGSESADDLSDILGARRVRVFDPTTHSFRRREGRLAIPARRGDVVISWGETLPSIEGVKVLNGGTLRSKFEDATRLKGAGVATIEVSRTQPPPTLQADPIPNLWASIRSSVNINRPDEPTVRNILGHLTRITDALQHPPTPTIWLPRRNNHMGGHDLVTPTTHPDFWSKKEALTQEFRLHMFLGKSIRAGVKRPANGIPHHEWIRSYDSGWRVVYTDFQSNKRQRELAAAACTALGLDFAAVDIGEKADGSLIVLELNRCPGLSDGSVDRYATAINGVVNEVS